MNILVTDGNFKHSLGIVRSLGKEGYKPYILSYSKNSLCRFSRYSGQEIIIDKNKSFADEITTQLKKYEIELIIVVGTNSYKNFVPLKDSLKEIGVSIISVGNDKLNLALSKKETYQLAESIGIPVAKTFYPGHISEISSLKSEITYPCVIKGLYEVGGNIVDYASDEEELELKYSAMCTKHSFSESTGLPMIQEYITGRGCGFFAVYNNGKCGLTFQHRRVREFPVTGGASVCAESYKNDLVQEYGKKLLDTLEWHGVAMVEFKLNDNHVPVLMEINPKFWGSTDLALEAGVNFPKALIDIYEGREIPFESNYKYPLKYHWPLHGDILHGLRKPSNLLYVLKDLLSSDVKSNIWLSDFRPTIRMFYDFIKQILIDITGRKK